MVHEMDGHGICEFENYGIGPSMLQKELNTLMVQNGVIVAWDDVSSATLNAEMVKDARATEMKFFHEMRVYDVVPREHQKKTGGPIIKTMWIYVNKGDIGKPNYRSRLVGKEYKQYQDDSLLRINAAAGGVATDCQPGCDKDRHRRKA